MAGHWTYDAFDPEEDLQQGDILAPGESLRAIFVDVHPHFADAKYLGFMIATQSCDLVRRNANPNAAYINLATIRPFAQVQNAIVSKVVEPAAPGIFPDSGKRRVKELLTRIFNQNEQSLGLFFLNEDSDSGVGEAALAFLRVTISLRAEHYETLRLARVGRLNSEFRAKLGWLLGNLYARPATRDWTDLPDGDKQLKKMVSHYVEEQLLGAGPKWVGDTLIQAAFAKGLDLATLTSEQFDALRPRSAPDRAIDEVRHELAKVAPALDGETVEKFLNRLKNNGKFRKLFPSAPPDD